MNKEVCCEDCCVCDKKHDLFTCEKNCWENVCEHCYQGDKEHRNKVDEINKSRHKNCINKERFMQYIKNTYRLNGYYEEVYKPIKTRIKDRWFDND
ncbi:hypothetical protein [Spiroplasma endosymbiont of Nomada ruficornis]|uniref:hypothetical protein n=1 Tax=Spiroplasma endosymbiont of Nomada ruficornis TaxID=3066325 RepID=UPI00313AA9D4